MERSLRFVDELRARLEEGANRTYIGLVHVQYFLSPKIFSGADVNATLILDGI